MSTSRTFISKDITILLRQTLNMKKRVLVFLFSKTECCNYKNWYITVIRLIKVKTFVCKIKKNIKSEFH
jgi:hypothetical protein